MTTVTKSDILVVIFAVSTFTTPIIMSPSFARLRRFFSSEGDVIIGVVNAEIENMATKVSDFVKAVVVRNEKCLT